MPLGALVYVREGRRCLLRITPGALTVAVPGHRYALTEIPRERIVSITGGTGARRGSDTGPVTQIAYLPGSAGQPPAPAGSAPVTTGYPPAPAASSSRWRS